ncbi:MAG: D-alanyl-D-alanine carboxypeptidase [Pseudomonadota bacterium]
MFRALLLGFLLLSTASVASQQIQDRVRTLAPNGLVHVVDEAGRVLVSQNADRPFVPASVAKIVTAWLAMEKLGGNYRFETRFYVDANRVLYVRGGGDPFLVSEELAMIAEGLVETVGTKPLSGLILDTSYFPRALPIPGVVNNNESYNASVSALAANFNTIHAVRNGDTVRSAEDQTPITPLAQTQFRTRAPNGRSRISLAQGDTGVSALYAGELIAAFVRQSGGDVDGQISTGRVPPALKPVYIHRQSRQMSEVVSRMLEGSNNYIANQIFLEVGAQRIGAPVSLEKSKRVLAELLETRGLTDKISMVEGSGISRENRMTAQGLAELLNSFAPYTELMERSPKGSRYKTGTLDTVSTLAGYAQTEAHGLVRFVIALPGRTGRLRFTILKAIEDGL